MGALSVSRALGIAAVALVLVFALLAVSSSHALMDFVIRLASLAIFATSLNLLAGYGGMVSFGHGMFYGFGAYCFALTMQRAGVSIPVAILATLVGAALLATVVGVICVRLKEIYFSFVTLAFQMLIHAIILAAMPLTGGDQGLRGGVPRPPFLGLDLSNQKQLCMFSAFLLVACLFAMHHIVASPFGATLRMIRDNADRAAYLGVAVDRVRLKAFVLAAIFASVGGLLQALFVSGAYPDFAYWTMSGEGIFVIMLGGTTTFLGPLLGSVLMLLLNDFVSRFTEYHGLALGSVILVVALGLKKGVGDFVIDWFSGRAEAAEAAREKATEAAS
jgi:branched-chain amino acid transport system permease protein